MKQLQPKSSVSLDGFRNRFRDTVLIVANPSPSVGRPRKTVLGDERLQMTRTVAARIANELVAEMERKAEVFDTSSRSLYDVSKRAEWAANQINQMSATDREAVDEDPFKLVEKMCGSLVTINTRKGENGRPEAVRIATAGATPAEFRIFADKHWKKGRRENQLSDRLAAAVSKVADVMAEGETFESAKARHYDNVRRGGPDEFMEAAE